MKIKIDDIKFSKEFYPRDSFSNEVVNNYYLNLENLPPIVVNQDYILIDGYHRLLAHRIAGLKEIEAEVVDVPKNKILWEAARRNAFHGKQLSREEKRRLARLFYRNNGFKLSGIAEVLAVSEATLSNWLRDEIKHARDEQQRRIIEFYLNANMTQQEIANKINISQGRIAQIINKFKIEKINNPPIPESLQLFNVWNFTRRDPRYGLEGAPGKIPGQIIENLLYYYTNPFDIVVDPMAGGGTTIDVCKTMYRRYLAYDINPLREDIIKWNITQGYPKEARNCDLIFLDPPYFKKLKDSFVSESVSSLPREEFLKFIGKLAEDSKRTVKKGGIVSLLISDYLDYESEDESILAFQYAKLFEDAGLTPINHISVPLTTQQWSPIDVERAKKKKITLEIARELYVFRKR